MPLVDVVQRSPEWRAARLGKVTGSRIADLMARTKTGPAASRANYMAELILERITGEPVNGYQSPAMLAGIEREPEALEAYELLTGVLVQPTGFWTHPHISGSGASPDALLIDDLSTLQIGGVEVKCPEPRAHLDALLSKTIPDRYLKQIHWCMACCPGRAWWDYVSYHPAFPEKLRLFVKRVPRDDNEILKIESEVADFLTEMEGKLASILALMEE